MKSKFMRAGHSGILRRDRWKLCVGMWQQITVWYQQSLVFIPITNIEGSSMTTLAFLSDGEILTEL